MRRPLEIVVENRWAAYVRGPAAWAMCKDAQRGRKPVWSPVRRAWVVSEATARNIVAAAEHGSLDVVVTGDGAHSGVHREDLVDDHRDEDLAVGHPDIELEGLW